MKLKDNYVTFGDENSVMMVSVDGTEFPGVLKGNGTVRFILEQLRTETDRDGIVAAMLREYDVSPELAAQDADRVLQALRETGALEEGQSN